jgi:hypothetical protein
MFAFYTMYHFDNRQRNIKSRRCVCLDRFWTSRPTTDGVLVVVPANICILRPVCAKTYTVWWFKERKKWNVFCFFVWPGAFFFSLHSPPCFVWGAVNEWSLFLPETGRTVMSQTSFSVSVLRPGSIAVDQSSHVGWLPGTRSEKHPHVHVYNIKKKKEPPPVDPNST